MRMNICFSVETSYQMYNVINFLLNRRSSNDFKYNRIDLFIKETNYFDLNFIHRLANENLFTNIYYYNLKKTLNKKNSYLDKFKEYIAPKKYLSSIIENHPDFNKVHYNILYIFYLTPMNYCLSLAFPTVEIQYIEDGLASYIEALPSLSWLKKDFLFRIKNYESPWKRINTLYLNNIELITPKNFAHIKKINLTSLTLKENDVVKRVFNYSNMNDYIQKPIIYLSRPQSKPNSQEMEANILFELKKYKNSIIYRKHPAQKEFDISSEFTRDNEKNIWELSCLYKISNNNVLIGEYSTAQFTPKILADKEPWIIFTYKLFKNDFSPIMLNDMTNSINLLRKSYKRKDKVFVPETVEELNKMVKRCLNGDYNIL